MPGHYGILHRITGIYRGQSRRDLAPVMNKNPDVVSWWVGEGSLRRVDDLSFAGRLDGLDKELAKSLTGGKNRRKNS